MAMELGCDMGHEPEHHHTGSLPTKTVLELLILWERHMASIDDQLKALSDKIDALEKPADISGLQTAVSALSAQVGVLQGVANASATNVASIAAKLPIDGTVAVPPPPVN